MRRSIARKRGRVVYRTCLENKSPERDREFESHRFRRIQSATHAIILTKDYAALIEWREFFKRQNIPVVLEVVSHQGQLPLMPRDLDLLYVKDLDRKVHHDGDVSAITKALIQKFKLN